MYQVILPIIFSILISGCGNTYDKNSTALISLSKNPCEHKPDIGTIKIDCTLEKNKYDLIANDLKQLESIHLTGTSSSQLRRALKLPNTSGITLRFWLEQRIKYIFAEDFQPLIRSDTAAMNIGSLYTRLGTESGRPPYILYLPGHSYLTVNSHQLGAIQLGPALFSDHYRSNWNVERARTLIRLGVLIHEARHSDEKGFPHVKCPATHPTHAHRASCDQSKNGSYGIENLFLKSAHESCYDCNLVEKLIIQLASQEIENFALLDEST